MHVIELFQIYIIHIPTSTYSLLLSTTADKMAYLRVIFSLLVVTSCVSAVIEHFGTVSIIIPRVFDPQS